MNRDHSIRGVSRPATDAATRQQNVEHIAARDLCLVSQAPRSFGQNSSQLSGHLLVYKQWSCHMLRWRWLGRVGESGLPVLADLVQIGGQSWSFSSTWACGRM
jgi:hypothetical protein